MVLALLLSTGAATLSTRSPNSAVPTAVTPTSGTSSDIYYNGTINGNGGTQTVDVPAPANGTVWNLVSAKITITAGSPVGTSQNAYLYDSACTQVDVAPAPSVCPNLYGPNVDGIANDVMDAGKDGTTVGEGGYASSTPAGVAVYTHFEQTIHLNHDMFVSFGADLSEKVSSSYYLVYAPEIGDYPSLAFYRWGDPVEPQSSTTKTVTLASPPAGYYYRAEIAITSIDFGSGLGPTRSAEIVEEPSGTVLALINDWTEKTEYACGGYSTEQTCKNDPAGTTTVWDNPVIVSAGESIQAKFVGVALDLGLFAAIFTEYPAIPAAPTGVSAGGATTSSLTWSWTNPGGDLTDDLFYWEAGSTCSSPAEVDLGGVAESHTVGSLSSGTEYCAYVLAVGAGGTSSASAIATGWTVPTIAPGAPTNVTATPENTSAIALSWTNPSGPLTDDYIGQYVGVNCSGSATVVNIGAVVSQYDLLNLSAGTNYSFDVAAANAVGEGSPSGCVNTTTGQGPPSAPTNLTATAVSPNTIDLLWTNPPEPFDDVYVETYAGLGCSGLGVATDVGAVVESFVSAGLSPSTNYSYQVEAANSAGAGPPSNCASATTSAELQNVSITLAVIVATPSGSNISGAVAIVDFQLGGQNFSISVGPTNASGNASYAGFPSGTTIENVSLTDQNYTLNSFTVSWPHPTVKQLLVLVTPVVPGENNSTAGQWVQVTEQGLPAETTWWVSVSGPESENLTCSGTTINLQLENGTYTFTIGTYSDLNASNPAGLLVVSTSPASLSVNFTSSPASPSGLSPSGANSFGSASAFFLALTSVTHLLALAVALVVAVYVFGRRRSSVAGLGTVWPGGAAAPGISSWRRPAWMDVPARQLERGRRRIAPMTRWVRSRSSALARRIRRR